MHTYLLFCLAISMARSCAKASFFVSCVPRTFCPDESVTRNLPLRLRIIEIASLLMRLWVSFRLGPVLAPTAY